SPDILKRFVTKIEEKLANIQEDLSVSAEIIIAPGDLKVYNKVTECWICKGFFIKPVLEIVQKIEKAKHNLLEIKEWKSCMEKEHSKKKEILACNSEMETDFGLKTSDLIKF
ncbi:hypothetical protein RhiirC2_719902, partial [Rhizophagus irregularis]